MKEKYLAILILLTSCNIKIVRNGCNVNAIEIMKENNGKVYVAYRKRQTIIAISDKGIDSVKGGGYYFYPSGELQSYKFFQNEKAYTYNEEYDESGKTIKMEGKPLVDRKIREVNIDSAFFRYSFYSLHKFYKDLQIYVSSGEHFSLKLTADSTYSNVISASFGINTKGLKEIYIFSRVEYENDCTNVRSIVTDSLFMAKTPHLGPAPSNSGAKIDE